MSTDFYVYLNIPNNKALVHCVDYPYCNHGKGRITMSSLCNGKWLGPFGESAARVKAA